MTYFFVSLNVRLVPTYGEVGVNVGFIGNTLKIYIVYSLSKMLPVSNLKSSLSLEFLSYFVSCLVHSSLVMKITSLSRYCVGTYYSENCLDL